MRGQTAHCPRSDPIPMPDHVEIKGDWTVAHDRLRPRQTQPRSELGGGSLETNATTPRRFETGDKEEREAQYRECYDHLDQGKAAAAAWWFTRRGHSGSTS